MKQRPGALDDLAARCAPRERANQCHGAFARWCTSVSDVRHRGRCTNERQLVRRRRSRAGHRRRVGRTSPAARPSRRGDRASSRSSTACPTGCTGSCGCRCSSATWWSARSPGWSSRSSTATCASPSASSLAMVLKLVTERVVRREMARLPQPSASAREPASPAPSCAATSRRQGPSFPSGHVILVAAIGCVVAPTLPAVWGWLPFALDAAGHARPRLRRRTQPARRRPPGSAPDCSSVGCSPRSFIEQNQRAGSAGGRLSFTTHTRVVAAHPSREHRGARHHRAQKT